MLAVDGLRSRASRTISVRPPLSSVISRSATMLTRSSPRALRGHPLVPPPPPPPVGGNGHPRPRRPGGNGIGIGIGARGGGRYVFVSSRSEERRVGKEGISRGVAVSA